MTLRRLAVLALVAAAAGLTGCAAAPQPLDGIRVVVYQPRTDIALGRLALQVVNDSARDLEVVGARLRIEDAVADAVWPGTGTTVVAGRTLDLRAPLPVFTCEEPGGAEVEVEYRDGATGGTLRLTPEDPYDLLPRLREEQCLDDRIAEIAVVTPRELRVADPSGPAVLVLDVAPTGAPGTVLVESVAGTTLLQPAPDGVAAHGAAPLGVELSADGPRELAVPFLPNRCDAHALADDKIGTIIPFEVTLDDGTAGRWLVPSPDDIKGAFYGYYAAHCGLAIP